MTQNPYIRPTHQPTLLRVWRVHRNLTQSALAERVGVSVATISRLESQKQGYTQSVLEALAEALLCDPADIISRRPGEPNDEVQRILSRAGKEKSGQILRVVRAMLAEDAENTG